MNFLRMALAGWVYLCLATILAQAGLLAVLWQRGLLTHHTLENLLIVAYEVPVGEMYEKMRIKAQPIKKEMLSFAEVQNGRLLAHLDLDLRDMSADKGLIDLHELDSMVETEAESYAKLRETFDQRWGELNKEATDSELQDVRRQIESVDAALAKDQLLRILDDPDLDPEAALHHVVTIFKGLPLDKRKKIVAEFEGKDADKLQDILREIRLGMPQSALIRATREQLQQVHIQK